MDPLLREAWLNNWLANLTGKPNSFKEMDLLQEHQNFWLKIIYNAKGANRSWDWLSMVSVSIFALRDVMRKVQTEFSTPFNSGFHSTPSITADIQIILDYLESLTIQLYTPHRENNDDSKEARDLIQTGAPYSNKPSAYRNFTYTKYKTKNHGFRDRETSSTSSPDVEDPDDGQEESEEEEEEEEASQIDSPHLQVDFEDLLLDEEEYPAGDDGEPYVNMVREVVDEFSRSH